MQGLLHSWRLLGFGHPSSVDFLQEAELEFFAKETVQTFLEEMESVVEFVHNATNTPPLVLLSKADGSKAFQSFEEMEFKNGTMGGPEEGQLYIHTNMSKVLENVFESDNPVLPQSQGEALMKLFASGRSDSELIHDFGVLQAGDLRGNVAPFLQARAGRSVLGLAEPCELPRAPLFEVSGKLCQFVADFQVLFRAAVKNENFISRNQTLDSSSDIVLETLEERMPTGNLCKPMNRFLNTIENDEILREQLHFDDLTDEVSLLSESYTRQKHLHQLLFNQLKDSENISDLTRDRFYDAYRAGYMHSVHDFLTILREVGSAVLVGIGSIQRASRHHDTAMVGHMLGTVHWHQFLQNRTIENSSEEDMLSNDMLSNDALDMVQDSLDLNQAHNVRRLGHVIHDGYVEAVDGMRARVEKGFISGEIDGRMGELDVGINSDSSDKHSIFPQFQASILGSKGIKRFERIREPVCKQRQKERILFPHSEPKSINAALPRMDAAYGVAIGLWSSEDLIDMLPEGTLGKNKEHSFFNVRSVYDEGRPGPWDKPGTCGEAEDVEFYDPFKEYSKASDFLKMLRTEPGTSHNLADPGLGTEQMWTMLAEHARLAALEEQEPNFDPKSRKYKLFLPDLVTVDQLWQWHLVKQRNRSKAVIIDRRSIPDTHPQFQGDLSYDPLRCLVEKKKTMSGYTTHFPPPWTLLRATVAREWWDKALGSEVAMPIRQGNGRPGLKSAEDHDIGSSSALALNCEVMRELMLSRKKS